MSVRVPLWCSNFQNTMMLQGHGTSWAKLWLLILLNYFTKTNCKIMIPQCLQLYMQGGLYYNWTNVLLVFYPPLSVLSLRLKGGDPATHRPEQHDESAQKKTSTGDSVQMLPHSNHNLKKHPRLTKSTPTSPQVLGISNRSTLLSDPAIWTEQPQLQMAGPRVVSWKLANAGPQAQSNAWSQSLNSHGRPWKSHRALGSTL